MPKMPLIELVISKILSCIGRLITRKQDEQRERQKEQQRHRRKFNEFTILLLQKFSVEVTKNSDLISLHESSKEEFRKQCIACERDIYAADQIMFKNARDEYLRFSFNECRDETQRPPPSIDKFGNYIPQLGWKPPVNFLQGRKHIKELLVTLFECSK